MRKILIASAAFLGLASSYAAVEARSTSGETAPFTCSTDAECARVPACALKPGCDGGPTTEPYRLIGFGCAGAKGPLYRDEEDEFPAGGCKQIEATF